MISSIKGGREGGRGRGDVEVLGEEGTRDGVLKGLLTANESVGFIGTA